MTHPWRQNGGGFSRKLTPGQISEIRRRYEAGEKGVKLAQEFGVSHRTIYNYVKGTR
jgi:hypothetical protein